MHKNQRINLTAKFYLINANEMRFNSLRTEEMIVTTTK